MKQIASFCGILVLLAGCGEPFHLRGNALMPSLQQGVYVQGMNTPVEFDQALRQGLERAGASIKQDPKAAQVTVTVNSYDEKRTVSGYSSTRQVREFNHALDVSIRVSGEGVADPTEARSVHVERTQIYDGTSVLGSSEEEATIKQDLRREAARLLLLRVRAAISSAAK